MTCLDVAVWWPSTIGLSGCACGLALVVTVNSAPGANDPQVEGHSKKGEPPGGVSGLEGVGVSWWQGTYILDFRSEVLTSYSIQELGFSPSLNS